MSSETEIMMSIIPHNENPTFVTYNFEEHLVAVWSWDDGNALSLTGNSSNHSIGSSKWMDIDNLGGDETDLKLWEFYYCLVKSTEEEKEGDGGDEEHKSSKNLLHLSKMSAKDDKMKAAVGQAVEDALSRAKKRSSSFNANGQSDLDFSDRREYVGQAVEDALSRGKKTFGSISNGRTYNALDGDVEGRNEKSLHNDIHAFKDQYGSVFDIKFTNPIALAALARRPQKTRETVIEPHNIPHVPKYDASPGVTRQKLDNIASPASESPKRNRCRSKSRSKTSVLDKTSSASPADDLDDDDRSAATNNSHTIRRKKPASRSPKRNKRRSKSRSKRSALDKALSASNLLGPPADDLDDDDRSAATNNSHTIRRKNPASRSPKRNKRRSKSRSKRSPLDKALSASHLLGPPADGLDDDDRSAATTNSHTKRKKSRDGRRRRSPSGERNDDDSADGKSKTKNRKLKRNRGTSKSKKPKMQKGQSSRNVNGERRRSGGDGDDISQLSNALLSPRSTKKKVRRGTWWDGERKCDDDDDDSLQMPIPPRRMMRKGSRKSMSDDDNDRSIHEYGEISLNDVSSTKSSRQRTSSRNVNRERQSDEDDATSMYGETSSNDSISICTLKSSKSTKKVNRKVTHIRNDYGERGSDDDVDTSQYGETSFNDSISTLMSSIRSTKMSIRNVTSSGNANGERGPDGDDETSMYGETSSNDSISTLKSSRSTKKISPNATYIRNANGQRQPDDHVDTSQYGETSFNDSSSTLQSSIRSMKKGSGKVTSSKNASWARQSDDDDETSTQEYRPASLNDISTCNLEIPRSTRIKGSRRVPRGIKRVMSESALVDSASEWKSKKKAANEKLEALNKRMKNAIGVDMNSIDSDVVSVASGRSLTERRARKRASQAKLKKTFDKIVVDKTLDATKSVGETVGKGAELGVDVNQTVGKGAMYVTRKGVGKAISVTKSTTPAAA